MNDKIKNLMFEIKSLKKLNEKQRSKSHSELNKKPRISKLKNEPELSDINIDINELKKENEELSKKIKNI